ncbi:MAG: hypothetical protein HXY20_03150 [Acidobacteria bacterium]|nr:hypothetical protein [Acidobacteriota bacterium]
MMRKTTGLALAVGLLLAIPSLAQDEEKIRKLFLDAIEAMGGAAFLEVKDMVSSGNYFAFDREGNSSGLIKYDDYTKLPDKSRFELGNKKKLRDVQVFNLEKGEGWILEGQKETRAATPDEMNDFKNAVKHSIDTIFRFRWSDPQNKLFYLGAGEGSDVRYELIKLLDPENDEVTVYFDRGSKLPAKLEYRSIDKRGVSLRTVVEFSQWHVIQSVRTPLRYDTLVNGRKLSQMFVVKIAYNNGLTDAFFAKPVPPK